MPQKRHTVDQIVAKLRKFVIELSRGMKVCGLSRWPKCLVDHLAFWISCCLSQRLFISVFPVRTNQRFAKNSSLLLPAEQLSVSRYLLVFLDIPLPVYTSPIRPFSASFFLARMAVDFEILRSSVIWSYPIETCPQSSV